MYGLPGQTWSDWLADLESALAYRPEHLACYMLTVEPGTPLADHQRSGRFNPAPEDHVAELFMATSEFLTDRGFLHYEISNFARCGAGAAALPASPGTIPNTGRMHPTWVSTCRALLRRRDASGTTGM
jgi:coproporphyrinogen III oxidase-like Fe-S oxidoreductase